MNESRENRRGPAYSSSDRVRIIGADEARAALDSGEAAGRRPDDQPRYGDVPRPPEGPRPPHRFPLAHSADPTEVMSRPPLQPQPKRPSAPAGTFGAAGEGTSDNTTEIEPERGLSVDSGEVELPHWSDPPTGEVPAVLREAKEGTQEGEDMAAWSALGTSGVRWRDEAGDWEGVEEIGELADPDYYEEPSGALGPSASEGSDLFSFDDDFEAAEARRTGSAPEVEVGAPTNDDDDIADLDFMAPARPAVRPRAARAHGSSRSVHGSRGTRGRRGGDSSQLASRVVVGVGLIVLLAIAYAVGPKALLVLAAALIVACAAEAYSMLQRCGFRPATLLGLVGTAGVVLGSYWRGTSAIAVCVVLMFAGSMAWYLLRIVEARPLANAAVTNMVFTWTGVLGSFAAVMLRAHQGKGLFLGTVIVAVVADIGAYAVGRWIGSRPFAGSVSPGKTMEGFLGGWAAAIVAGAIVGKEISPWGGMKHGLLLGLLLGLVTAGGDLFESMLKRDLQLKDSGSLLGGHGGLLDRFDGILVALPFAYGLAWLFSIVK